MLISALIYPDGPAHVSHKLQLGNELVYGDRASLQLCVVA